MLDYLSLNEIGPANSWELSPASRLNLLTGDNGLGKTLLLDAAWWALTGQWASYPIQPREGCDKATIAFRCCPKKHLFNDKIRGGVTQINYDWESTQWVHQKPSNADSTLVLFVKADGAIALRDPYRNDLPNVMGHTKIPPTFLFSSDQVWDGLTQDKQTWCNGLVSDWLQWQYRDTQTFKLFKAVLDRLVPYGQNRPVPADPVRLATGDTREIPSLRFAYGVTPVLHLSAGMKRALVLAYLLVWSWREHTIAAKQRKKEPLRQIILLIDELEAHLHPHWQRSILPAILEVIKILDQDLDVQLFISSHSPLSLASIEPEFDLDKDKIFNYSQENGAVTIQEMPWVRHGDVVGWLTSDIFGLGQARSLDAERAIAAANAFSRGELDALPEALKTREAIETELTRVLASDDPFWPRWMLAGSEA